MTDAPERIHLDGDSEAGEGMFPRCFENPKYCSEPAIEYIRADLVEALEAESQRLRKALKEIDHGDGWGWCGQIARAALSGEGET